MVTMSISEEKYNEVFRLLDNELGFGILTAISLYESLNLKSISELLNRRPSTITHQLKYLLEKKYIILDLDMTQNKTGKFYKLTEFSLKLFEDEMDQVFLELTKRIDNKSKDHKLHPEKDIDILNGIIITLRAISSLQKNIALFITNTFEKRIEKLKSQNEMIDLSKEGFKVTATLNTLNINTSERKKKIDKIVNTFLKDMNSLNDEFNQEDKLKEQERKKSGLLMDEKSQFVYFFSSPMNMKIFE